MKAIRISRIAALFLAAWVGQAPQWALAAAAGTDHVHADAAAGGPRVTVVDYTVPPVTLLRDDGRRVGLVRELDDGRPVVLNFIYTTCPGVCPLMSAVFADFQSRLGDERSRVHMVSISIDPEQDSPARLRAYAQKFSAGSQWQHYTGTVASSVAVQKAFDAYRGDKMSHDPLTLMRLAPGKPWVRVDGFATGPELMERYLQLAWLCEHRPE